MKNIFSFFKKRILIVLCLIFFSNIFIFSESNFFSFNSDFIKEISQIAFGIGLLIFISQIAALLFKKLNLPQNLGELLAGITMSPVLLGRLIFPCFNLMDMNQNLNLPVFNEMLLISILSSIIILFMIGLETNLSALSHYSLNGFIIGFSGIACSFMSGILLSHYLLNQPLLSIENLFMGFITSTTSTGIIFNIIQEKTKMALNERMSLFSSIIMDNIISIFNFIVFVSLLIAFNGSFETVSPDSKIIMILFKNLFLWFIPVILIIITTMIFQKISEYFKIFDIIPMIVIGLIVLIIGIFVKFGFFIILAAYLAGLAISKTKYNFTIRDNLRPIYHLFSPIFYVFVGMFFNVQVLIEKPVYLFFGLLMILMVIAFKFFGNLISSLFLKFKFFHSLRISFGLMPRFEIALIIGFIGYLMKILNSEIFTLLIMFVILSSVFAIPVFFLLTKKQDESVESNLASDKTGAFELKYQFESEEVNRILTRKLIDNFKQQDFAINLIGSEQKNYQIKKDELFFNITCYESGISIESSNKNMPFINTLVYETLNELNKSLDKSIKNKEDTIDIKSNIIDSKRNKVNIKDILFQENIILNMSAKTKKEVLEEFLELFYKNGYIKEKAGILETLLNRERVMSTGMQQGIAIPHCKSKYVDKMIMAIGLSRDGINFESIDGKPSKIFVMLLAPEGTPGPHLHALMLISSVLIKDEAREKLINMDNAYDIWKYMNDFTAK